MTKVTKELLIKTLAFVLLIAILMYVDKVSGLFDTIKEISSRISNPSAHPLNSGEWAALFGYRFIIYFALPILVTAFELIFIKTKRCFAWAILNFEAHFIALSIVCGVYYVLALDYVMGAKILTIEHSVTSLMLLLFTILLSKKFPHIFIPDEKGLFQEEKDKGEN